MASSCLGVRSARGAAADGPAHHGKWPRLARMESPYLGPHAPQEEPVAGTALMSCRATGDCPESRQTRPGMCSGDGGPYRTSQRSSPGPPSLPNFRTCPRQQAWPAAPPFLRVPPTPVSPSPQSSCPHVPTSRRPSLHWSLPPTPVPQFLSFPCPFSVSSIRTHLFHPRSPGHSRPTRGLEGCDDDPAEAFGRVGV